MSDASTRTLMREYYGELARGTGRAEALRRAKLHLLREPRYAHPYYWAAFIPAGDWRPLDKMVLLPRRPQHPYYWAAFIPAGEWRPLDPSTLRPQAANAVKTSAKGAKGE